MALVKGVTGRVYTLGDVLQRKHNQDSVIQVAWNADLFVVKTNVHPYMFTLLRRLLAGFAHSRRLRMHVDYSEDKTCLIYPYFKDTPLGFVKKFPGLPLLERKKVLHGVGEAIKKLHRKDWIHADIKPDNVLVDWTLQSDDTGIHALGGADFLLLDDYHELLERGITAEQEIVTRNFCYFGPATQGLLQQVNDKDWCKALKSASQFAAEVVNENSQLKFEYWGKELGAQAQDIESRMTSPYPYMRPTIEEVMAHSRWQQD